MKKINILDIAFISSVLFILSGCSDTKPLTCGEVSSEISIDGLSITSAELIAAGTEAVNRSGSVTADVVEYCKVTGAIEERVGIDHQGNSTDYAIQFELRLPTTWNNKFFHQFNGGSDGSVKSATGVLPASEITDIAINRGYAVVSSDAGHDGSAFPSEGYSGGSIFGFDPTARINYGYGAVQKLTPIAKQIIERFYASSIKYTYGVGSSNGGRHGMVAATRTYNEFDGFFLAYPGYNLPKAAVQHAHDIQQFNSILSSSLVDTSTDSITIDVDDILDVVSKGITDTCDGLDGLVDGLVYNTAACQTTFNINDLVCSGGVTTDCISQKEADAIANIHKGPKNTNGDNLYNTWYYDPGLNGSNWKQWKTDRIVYLGGPSLAQTFSTAPTKIGALKEDALNYLLAYNFDTDAPKIYATNSTYTESGMEFMRPTDADNPMLTKFNAKGGKMIIIHGTSDPVFSAKDTSDWFEKLDANYDGDAESFVRYFTFPGMPHSSTSGVTVNKVDFLTALENWVENGVAPSNLVATTNSNNRDISGTSLEGATRPVCPYPTVATYNGTGDSMLAENFTCK